MVMGIVPAGKFLMGATQNEVEWKASECDLDYDDQS